MELINVLYAVLALGGMGLLFGVLLAVASKAFYVKTDERVEQIHEALPGANCGGCGFSGCSAFATNVVSGNAQINGCPVSNEEIVKKIAAIMGVEADSKEKTVAKVMCSGCDGIAKKKFEYNGIDDCVAAVRLGGGDRECQYGCVGLGSCVKKCQFDAIEIIDGVAVVNPEKCTSCGMCIDICPKGIIESVPYKSTVWVACSSKDKGPVVRQVCNIGCIACRICEKVCPEDAIKVNDNCAAIDYSKCTNCGECVRKCPRKVIFMHGEYELDREALNKMKVK